MIGNGYVKRPTSLIPTGIKADGGGGGDLVTSTDCGGDCVKTDAPVIGQCGVNGSVVYGGGT